METSPSQGSFIAFRLPPGTNLVEGLRATYGATGSRAMAVVTCVGSLTQVHLRHANQATATPYAGHFEILSLVGTMDAQGQHLHLSIGDGQGRVFGGHLMPEGSAIHTTAEIVVLQLSDVVFTRAACALSGHDELVVLTA